MGGNRSVQVEDELARVSKQAKQNTRWLPKRIFIFGFWKANSALVNSPKMPSQQKNVTKKRRQSEDATLGCITKSCLLVERESLMSSIVMKEEEQIKWADRFSKSWMTTISRSRRALGKERPASRNVDKKRKLWKDEPGEISVKQRRIEMCDGELCGRRPKIKTVKYETKTKRLKCA